jgi:hypothetical protein
MKVIKVKKADADMELFDWCRQKNKEYRNKFKYIEIDANDNMAGTMVVLSVNWSAVGAQTPDETVRFANDLLSAVKILKKIEAEGKKKFPNVDFRY